MKAVRVHRFGGLDEVRYEDADRPAPGDGQVLVRVRAAGVGPWDAWIRSGRSALPQPLPLTLGSDLEGVVVSAGPGAEFFQRGDAVFGVTNARFTGAQAEYAAADAGMIARAPTGLSPAQAASIPVVASTALQMVEDHGRVEPGSRVLVHGGAGNVGAYAVQLARRAGAQVFATARAPDVAFVRSLGADAVLDPAQAPFEEKVRGLDVVLDTVGGEAQRRSFEVLAPGGVLVSSVSPPDSAEAERRGVRAAFFLVAVTTAGLSRIASLLGEGLLSVQVGEVLPLAQARIAHEMLEGRPHRSGKIVLEVGA